MSSEDFHSEKNGCCPGDDAVMAGIGGIALTKHRDDAVMAGIGGIALTKLGDDAVMAGIGGIALTKHGDELCFEESIFLEPEFNAERFVSSCRRRVTLEHLRVDLEAFFKTLKTSLVELINSDYADFVSLSAKLVGPVAV